MDIVRIDKETGLPVMDNSFARVVRCKDCKYWDNHDGGERCLNKIAYLSWAKPNSFCSYAERKGEGEKKENGNID